MNIIGASGLSANMLAVGKIRGSIVYTTTLEQVASVEDLLVDIATGRIVQVVLKHGGHLGVGHQFYLLPWKSFTYNEELGGYIVDLDYHSQENVLSRVDLAKPGIAPWKLPWDVPPTTRRWSPWTR